MEVEAEAEAETDADLDPEAEAEERVEGDEEWTDKREWYIWVKLVATNYHKDRYKFTFSLCYGMELHHPIMSMI